MERVYKALSFYQLKWTFGHVVCVLLVLLCQSVRAEHRPENPLQNGSRFEGTVVTFLPLLNAEKIHLESQLSSQPHSSSLQRKLALLNGLLSTKFPEPILGDCELWIGVVAGILSDDKHLERLWFETIIEMAHRNHVNNKALRAEQSNLLRCLEKEPFKAWERLLHEKPALPVVNRRSDEESTFIVKGVIPDDGGLLARKGTGVLRAPLDGSGKEILPPHHLILKFNFQTRHYCPYFTDKDSVIRAIPTEFLDRIPGPLIGGKRESLYFIRNSDGSRFESALGLKSPALLFVATRSIDAMLVYGDWDTEEEFDSSLESAAKHRLRHSRVLREFPVIPNFGKLTLQQIEENLEIGLASKDECPLAFAWVDPASHSFFVVDEQHGVAYWQEKDTSKEPILHGFEVLALSLFGEDANGKHYVLGKSTSDVGLQYQIKEVKLRKGWIVRNQKGHIFRLETVKGAAQRKESAAPVELKPFLPIEETKAWRTP